MNKFLYFVFVCILVIFTIFFIKEKENQRKVYEKIKNKKYIKMPRNDYYNL